MRRCAACRLLEEVGQGIGAGIQPHPNLTRKCTRLATCCGQLQLNSPCYSRELLRNCSPALVPRAAGAVASPAALPAETHMPGR